MAASLVGTVNFSIMGKDVDVWKEEAENGNRPVLCRNPESSGSHLIHQFLIDSAADDPTIMTNAETELNELGWK